VKTLTCPAAADSIPLMTSHETRTRRFSRAEYERLGSRYFIGEKAVGRRTVVVTCCTMGPFFSLSANTRARSGSFAKMSNLATRSSRLCQASR